MTTLEQLKDEVQKTFLLKEEASKEYTKAKSKVGAALREHRKAQHKFSDAIHATLEEKTL